MNSRMSMSTNSDNIVQEFLYIKNSSFEITILTPFLVHEPVLFKYRYFNRNNIET